ncbi:RNA polymerase sigma factor [Catellatospora methionotrophica]|uniref:RNA polymerase sigma factor n=1 Tax=Catellatospora methionotrophica TaxID=121620 RepID=A0A8J3LDD6_9ACTN|nr:sigma-70 family RNA polymerase sigma factor [Catellatospora methionotrophica]GIG18687.1 RNA polymerase sigma factor [Catellatospora methionotrophica]
MHEQDRLAERFEQDRGRLRAVALRMLGSSAEADDAVQEAWLRLSRTDAAEVGNLSGWLTTVVGRICLDMLRSRSTRREDLLDDAADTDLPPLGATTAAADPEQQAVLADSVGLALLVVLDTLSPAERLAFVLHDMFAVPFDELAPVIGKSPDAARQLASRARRRVQGQTPTGDTDQSRRRQVVEAFLAAAREGRFEALVTMLDPDVVMRADATAVSYGSTGAKHGAAAVAGYWNGQAAEARTALLDGVVNAVWAPRGKVRVALAFTIVDDRIAAIDLTADRDRLADLDVELL